jgi:hypothetical protein
LRATIATDSLNSTVRSFLPSRAVVEHMGVVVVAVATWAAPVRAQTVDSTPLSSMRAAWDSGDFDRVPALCQKALTQGGLGRADVLDAYTRLGAALAIDGQRKPAIAAFRKAALIDPGFKVPPEAGKNAAALAEVARRSQIRSGTLALSMQTPDTVDSGSAFGVEVALTAPTRGNSVTTLTLDATDTLAARSYEQRGPAGPHAHFDVPARMALPDASLLVRVHARDGNDNELAEAERRVHIAAAPGIVAQGPLAALATAARKDDRGRSGGGFWSSPWPYVIGGAALAAGGVTTWFLTRPTDNVDVGAVRVQLVH